ncbi:MAG: hypothetical protein ACO1OB_29560 [Archangium sp.]
MTRVLLVGLLFCGCRQFDCVKANGCVDRTTAIAAAIRGAETQWLERGECHGVAVGASGSGTWVHGDPPGFCGQTDYFDESGEVRASKHCCEGDCTEYGVIPENGPQVRDLCTEARAGLLEVGTGASSSSPLELRAEDGGVVTPLTTTGRKRWQLGAGIYDVRPGRPDGGTRFEVPADGGAVVPLGAGKLKCNRWRCELAVSRGAWLVFNPALARRDGGTR